MKKIIKLLSIIMVISMLFCLFGCEKSESLFGHGRSESDYKSAMSEHMQNEHKSSINSYTSFNIYDDGGAYAEVQVTAHLAGSDGTIGMSNKLSVDKDCNISSCSWCDLGIG